MDINFCELDQTSSSESKSYKRAIRRKKDIHKAIRKKNIDLFVHYRADIYPWYNSIHQYSKNKIHCSCYWCSSRKRKFSYYSHSDLMKLAKTNYDLYEYNNIL